MKLNENCIYLDREGEKNPPQPHSSHSCRNQRPLGFTLVSVKALTDLKAKSFGGDAYREAYLLETMKGKGKGREERWNKELMLAQNEIMPSSIE